MSAHFGRGLALDVEEGCPESGPKADPNLGFMRPPGALRSRLKVLNIFDHQEPQDVHSAWIINAYWPNGHHLEPFASCMLGYTTRGLYYGGAGRPSRVGNGLKQAGGNIF